MFNMKLLAAFVSEWTLAAKGNIVVCPELQIRGDIEDNSKTVFLISQQKHML